jgi:hypothetical protein
MTSLVVEPAMDWVWLAEQVVHVLQVAALTCVLNDPELQVAHCRSVVVVGAAVCLLPGRQSVSAWHFRSEVAVAGVASNSFVLQTVSD